MEYILIDQVKNGDCFTEEFSKFEDAKKCADVAWHRMSEYDKKSRESFFVLKSASPDPDAIDHMDGDPVYTIK